MELFNNRVISIQAEGSSSKVGVLYSIVKRKNIRDIVQIIQKHNPNAFYTIKDIRFVSQQIRGNRNNKCE
jgi:uncharacterized membrane-anchored protein YitT (DUF2179 family)